MQTDETLLSGVRVVDCSTHAAGPSVGSILGDLGADVIKIEDPVDGDPYRKVVSQAILMDPDTDGRFNSAFELVNRNKRDIALSLKTPEGREVLDRLVSQADVFITNKLPRVQKSLGIDYERLSAINPRLIYQIISGYGTKGPLASRPGFDFSAYWAASSQMGMFGKMLGGGRPPMNRGGMGDRASGMAGAGAIGLALFNRERTGKGQMIDTSLLHVGLWTVAVDIQRTAVLGGPVPYDIYDENPLWNSYKTKDGHWLILACLQQVDWAVVARAIGRDDLAEDPRYITFEERMARSAEVVALLEVAFAERTREEWEQRLDAARINWSPVALPEEVVASEQVAANEIFLNATHPGVGEYRLLRSPYTFSRTPARFSRPAPGIGEHTDEILAELGYGKIDVERIKDSQEALKAAHA